MNPIFVNTVSKVIKDYFNYKWFFVETEIFTPFRIEDELFDTTPLYETLYWNIPFDLVGLYLKIDGEHELIIRISRKEDKTINIQINNIYDKEPIYKTDIIYNGSKDKGYAVRGRVGITKEQIESAPGKTPKEKFDNYCAFLIELMANGIDKINSSKSVVYTPCLKKKKSSSAKNRKTFVEWHTVVLEPKITARSNLGGTHASPRFHERRGHWRTLKSGKKTWINSMKVGKLENGIILKDYVVEV
jgi:hypothetical protein